MKALKLISNGVHSGMGTVKILAHRQFSMLEQSEVEIIWARSCEHMSYAICEQQRRRSACASAQSDQHLCCSLPRWYDMYACYIKSFKILASFCSWAGWFEPYLVKNLRRHIFAWWGSYNGSTFITTVRDERRAFGDYQRIFCTISIQRMLWVLVRIALA